LGAYCACAIAFSISATTEAAFIESDWQSSGDNLLTIDTASGLEWLDVPVVLNRSYIDVSSQFGIGGDFEGFRYATVSEVGDLFQNAGLTLTPPEGTYTGEGLLVEALQNLVGITVVSTPQLNTFGMTSDSAALCDEPDIGCVDGAWLLRDTSDLSLTISAAGGFSIQIDQAADHFSSWLVRDTAVVPIPPAVWLFGSGLLGLVGMARRKKAA